MRKFQISRIKYFEGESIPDRICENRTQKSLTVWVLEHFKDLIGIYIGKKALRRTFSTDPVVKPPENIGAVLNI